MGAGVASDEAALIDLCSGAMRDVSSVKDANQACAFNVKQAFASAFTGFRISRLFLQRLMVRKEPGDEECGGFTFCQLQ